MARDLLRQRLHVVLVVESRCLVHVVIASQLIHAIESGSRLLGFGRGRRRLDWHELAFCRCNHLSFLHHGLLVSLDVVVSETLDCLLFGLELIFEDLELDLVLPELLPLLLQVKPQLPQLFVLSVLVRLEVADLLAINLILLALLLDLLRLPIELLLLNAVLV